ncbi:hypothetical protein ABD76_00040 [Paenibacillus dendritiformis]|nr:hypothetical protein [Paenibacillus dendritiformis]MBG9791012.1 hypothetical protein [Paenibacillus dendritiformis]
MGSLTIWLDCSFFTNDVIARAAHRYSGRYETVLYTKNGRIGVQLSSRTGGKLPDDLEARFHEDALDERLRASIRKETQDLHAELIRAALREAQPRTADLDR